MAPRCLLREGSSLLSTHGVALREVTATLHRPERGEVVLASAFFPLHPVWHVKSLFPEQGSNLYPCIGSSMES